MSTPDSEQTAAATSSSRPATPPLHVLREQERAGAAAEGPVEDARRLALRRPVAMTRRPTGRERHDEKITIYVSSGELFDLEQARLVLRGEHGLAVDRGRIVREAIAIVLADLEAKGPDSALVRRLTQE